MSAHHCGACGMTTSGSDRCTNSLCDVGRGNRGALRTRRSEETLESRLAAIRARLGATTPGTWKADEVDGEPCVVALDLGMPRPVAVASWVSRTKVEGLTRPDAEFIAHAKGDVELLLALVAEFERVGAVR